MAMSLLERHVFKKEDNMAMHHYIVTIRSGNFFAVREITTPRKFLPGEFVENIEKIVQNGILDSPVITSVCYLGAVEEAEIKGKCDLNFC